LWTRASCDVKVPGDLAKRNASELRAGGQVIVAGQLRERWVVEGAVARRREVIVAMLIKSGPPPTESGPSDAM